MMSRSWRLRRCSSSLTRRISAASRGRICLIRSAVLPSMGPGELHQGSHPGRSIGSAQPSADDSPPHVRQGDSRDRRGCTESPLLAQRASRFQSLSVLLALLRRALDAENWHFIEGREVGILGDNGYAVPQCGRSDPGVVAAEASAARPLG